MGKRAVLGLSHTPLLGLNPLAPEVDADLRGAIDRARDLVLAFAPELIVLFFPDHFNGFFHEVMPPICIGTEGSAVGDYGTSAGRVNVASEDALALTRHLIDREFDIALSRRMTFDHGVAQPLDLLFGGLDAPPIVPVFINGAGPPAIAKMSRVIRLGREVGEFFANDPRRILYVGSGGLSHDPPIPTLENPDPAMRERIIGRFTPTPEQRAQRQERVIQAGIAMGAGTSDRKPLNAQWDTRVMDALEAGDFATLTAMPEDSIVREGGGSAHETKNWVAAFAAAAATPMLTRERWYRAIPDLIAGFGVMVREG